MVKLTIEMREKEALKRKTNTKKKRAKEDAVTHYSRWQSTTRHKNLAL